MSIKLLKLLWTWPTHYTYIFEKNDKDTHIIC